MLSKGAIHKTEPLTYEKFYPRTSSFTLRWRDKHLTFVHFTESAPYKGKH